MAAKFTPSKVEHLRHSTTTGYRPVALANGQIGWSEDVASGGTPGGSDTQVQFNNSGSFGGSSKFIWDGNTVKLEPIGTHSVPALNISVPEFVFGNGNMIAVSANGNTSGLYFGVTNQGIVTANDIRPHSTVSGGLQIAGDATNSGQYINVRQGDVRIFNSSDLPVIWFNGNTMSVGTQDTPTAAIDVESRSTTTPVLKLTAETSQTADIFQIFDASDNLRLAVDSGFELEFRDSSGTLQADLSYDGSNDFYVESYLSSAIRIWSRDNVWLKHGPGRSIIFANAVGTQFIAAEDPVAGGNGGFLVNDHEGMGFLGRVDGSPQGTAMVFANDVSIVSGDYLAEFTAGSDTHVRIGDPTKNVEMFSVNTTQVSVVIEAIASQTADTFQIQDSSNNVLAGFASGGALRLPITTVTAPSVTLDGSHYDVLCDCSSNAITVNLPAASTCNGRIYNIKKIDSSPNAATVDGNGSETIDGSLTQVLSSQWDSLTIHSNGLNWYIK